MNKWTWLPIAAALIVACAGTSAASPPAETPAAEAPVVFVCDHGSVKSLMAASLFNEAAARRGLRVRAVSRGVNPDAGVPAAIATAMKRDGFDVGNFHPQALSEQDVAGAARVVAIGVGLSEHDGVARATDRLLERRPAGFRGLSARPRRPCAGAIEALLDEMQQTEMKPQ